MAADLHIHVMTDDITEDDLAAFFSSTLGSKWFSMYNLPNSVDRNAVFEKISNTPNVWVGEVSWLKAALFEDSETFVPDLVQAVHEIVGEDFPVINDTLIDKLNKAMHAGNKTAYSTADDNEIVKFLKKHRGKKVFTVSW
jgi:hypothetical protein